MAEGAGLGRLKGEQQHKLPLSDTAIVALGEVKTHGLVFEGAFELICIRGSTSSRANARTTFKTGASNKTHHAWEAIEAALAHSIGNKLEIRPIPSSRSGGR